MSEDTDKRVSVWDGRQKFYDQWNDRFTAIPNLLMLGEYEKATHLLCAWITSLIGKTRLVAAEVRLEIYEHISKIKSLESYQEMVIAEEAAEQRIILDTIFDDYMSELMSVMDQNRMLVPSEERIASDDPRVVADNYERYAYGEVSGEQNKEVTDVIEYMDDYEGIDEELRAVIARQRWLNEKKRKDALWIIFGAPGSGKSNLAHHIHEVYTAGNPDIENVAFDKTQFSNTITRTLKLSKISDRFSHYDEANVNKRDSMTGWNKDLIDLYESIREYNGFHIWCNPSAEYLDKKFIIERVNALIYIYQGTGRKRRYAIIPRQKLLMFLEKHKSLKTTLMDKHAADHSIVNVKNTYIKDYQKTNLEYYGAYLRKKNTRLDHKLQHFQTRWSADEQRLSSGKAAKVIGVTQPTIKYHIDQLIEKGVFTAEEVKTPTNQYRLTPEHIKAIKNNMVVVNDERYDKLREMQRMRHERLPQPVPSDGRDQPSTNNEHD